MDFEFPGVRKIFQLIKFPTLEFSRIFRSKKGQSSHQQSFHANSVKFIFLNKNAQKMPDFYLNFFLLWKRRKAIIMRRFMPCQMQNLLHSLPLFFYILVLYVVYLQNIHLRLSHIIVSSISSKQFPYAKHRACRSNRYKEFIYILQHKNNLKS